MNEARRSPLKKHLQDLLTQLASQTTTVVAPTAAFEKEINSRACQFGLNAALLGKAQAKPEVAEALLKTIAAYAQKLEVTNEKLRSELAKYRVPELIRELFEAEKRDPGFLERLNKTPRARKGLSLAERKARNARSKQLYDLRRSFRERPGMIEEQFTGPAAAAVCLDVLLSGGEIKRSGDRSPSCEQLFGRNRKRFPKALPSIKNGRERSHKIRAVIKIAEHLLRKGLWLRDVETRRKVLMGIQQHAERVVTNKRILSEVENFVKRHLPSS
jgi:hypothetical protein